MPLPAGARFRSQTALTGRDRSSRFTPMAHLAVAAGPAAPKPVDRERAVFVFSFFDELNRAFPIDAR